MAEAPTILVADDDAEWRNLISFALQRAGYRVVLAQNGKGVLPLAATNRPAAFILDHDLGDMTGGQVCRDIKALPQHQSTPVVILTAHAEYLPGLMAGTPPDQFVVKTGSTEELLAVLATLVPLAA